MKFIANAVELVGLVLLVGGFWAMWAPLGAVAAGLILVVVAQLADRSEQ